LNNKFIPLDQAKLKQCEEEELETFKRVQFLRNSLTKNSPNTSVRSLNLSTNSSGFGQRANTSESFLNFQQNKLDNHLVIKITNEEEKYVYLLKKLRDYPHFVSIFIIKKSV
jgi:hypothetical protein